MERLPTPSVRLCALLLLAACSAAEPAGQKLQTLGQASHGKLLVVTRADFPDGDPQRGTPSTDGSRALRDAVIADAGIAAFVRAHGIPDGIGIGFGALTTQLAYLQANERYTL